MNMTLISQPLTVVSRFVDFDEIVDNNWLRLHFLILYVIQLSGNIDPKPGMSHYIPCLIAE
jgi:hypothetical protein